MWVQGVTIKNKHKALNYLKELSRMNFEEITIIVKGRDDYEKFKRLFDRNIRREGGNNNRKFRHRD